MSTVSEDKKHAAAAHLAKSDQLGAVGTHSPHLFSHHTPPSNIPLVVDGEVFETTTESRRSIGVFSAIFLIFNRMVGTGIFATPSAILSLSGSVGLALILWVVGTLISATGMAVYLEFGTAIPKNGGEKNYLEFVYRKPKFLVTGMFGMYVFLLGWAGSNSVVFGEYILHAAGVEVGRWNQRGIGLACITSAFLIHGLALKWGLRLQNALGVIKLVIILIIVVSGWAALGGALKVEKPDNFTNAFEGTTASAYGIVNALYSVMWSFIGYSNANYALQETRNPVRTLKIAAPVALLGTGVLYMLVNIAYFAAVPKDEIISSGRILAASFFRNVFGTASSSFPITPYHSLTNLQVRKLKKPSPSSSRSLPSATSSPSSSRRAASSRNSAAKASSPSPASSPPANPSTLPSPVSLSTGSSRSSSCSRPLPATPTTSS